jgi:predicted nucleic acid-binding protein
MPSGKTKFAVYDTSIYIEDFRTGRFRQRLVESSMIPRCSAVVLHELSRGARTRDEVALVATLSRNCRIVTPSEEHWRGAAEILKAIRKRERYDGSKLAGLTFDVLIALSARSIGATLVTTNKGDFAAIRRELSFEVAYW